MCIPQELFTNCKQSCDGYFDFKSHLLRSGGPGLKATQEYPVGFGERLFELYKRVKDIDLC